MTRKLDRTQIADIARLVAPATVAAGAAPEAVAHPPRTFELPAGLYAATVASYLGFIGVMTAAFGNPGLVLPIAIIALTIVAGFGVPGLWARMHPESRGAALTWGQFRNRGVQTHTGRLAASDATIQVLILPTLILLWGVIVAVIAATV